MARRLLLAGLIALLGFCSPALAEKEERDEIIRACGVERPFIEFLDAMKEAVSKVIGPEYRRLWYLRNCHIAHGNTTEAAKAAYWMGTAAHLRGNEREAQALFMEAARLNPNRLDYARRATRSTR